MRERGMMYLAPISLLLFVAVGACGAELSTRTKSDVQRRLETRSQAFEGCYERALVEDDQAEGKVTLVFLVAPDGVFRQVKVARSTVNNKALETCLVSKTKGLRTASGVSAPLAVTYEINLKARNENL